MAIIKCVEYSYSNLSTDAQNLLLCLAPFNEVVKRYFIPFYIDELEKLEPFKDYAFDKFNVAIQEAINWGLLSPLDSEHHDILTIQPIFTYFLNTKLEATDDAIREALREGFKNHYLGVASYYHHLINSKDAQDRQLGQEFCKLEYKNLYIARQICLDKQESIDVFVYLSEYLNLVNDIQISAQTETIRHF